jgi:AcrR family transcriptional regulator
MDVVIPFLSAQAEVASPNSPRRSSEDRRQEIVHTVLALVGEIGVEAITTQSIAERMGLTQGAVFRHFPNKEAIWSAVLDSVERQLEAVYQPLPGASPLAEVRRVFETYLIMFQSHPAVPKLFFSDTFHHAHPVLHARLQDMVRGCESRLAHWLGEAAATGHIRADISGTTAAAFLLVYIQGLAFQTCVLGVIKDPLTVGRSQFSLYLAGLGASMEGL